jgi:uncharacterized Tic20 family protein
VSDNPYDAHQGPYDAHQASESQAYGEPYAEYPELSSEVRNWAMLTHLTSLLGLATGMFFLGPLVVWLLKKDEHPFIDEQGKESLNFQISMLIYEVVAALLLCVLVGFVLLPILVAVHVIFVIIASIKVSAGEDYRYPLTIRFLR